MWLLSSCHSVMGVGSKGGTAYVTSDTRNLKHIIPVFIYSFGMSLIKEIISFPKWQYRFNQGISMCETMNIEASVRLRLLFISRISVIFLIFPCVLFKGLIMDRCMLLTSTPEWVVSPRRAITRAQPSGCALVIARRGETTHEGVDVNNTHLSMINPDYNMMLAISVTIYQYSAY